MAESGSQRRKILAEESEKLLTKTEATKARLDATRAASLPVPPSLNRSASDPYKVPSCPTSLPRKQIKTQSKPVLPSHEKPPKPMQNIPNTSNNRAVASPASPPATRSPLEQRILDELMEDASSVSWSDIVGLEYAKQTLQEAVILPNLHPELFSGLRSPPKGVLLFGPPGTGKTLLAKAVASESGFNFFSISASSLTSKWMGEGEKLVRTLFALAREMQPSVIFMDEIDSVLSKRSENEHESSRRLKTEFMIQLDGAATSSNDKLLVIGATNLPHEIDDAVLRRLSKRVYVPLPDPTARGALLSHLLPQNGSVKVKISDRDRQHIITKCDHYSCSDINALCKEAAMGPVRDLLQHGHVANATPENVRPVSLKDFEAAFKKVRPSVSSESLQQFIDWERDNS
mmetsp:Transcript_3390/g.4199  ORF Transcript_3390/g.4199 Transcript_3390/m.4199 type:complete len:402 (+) Transcript_3390:382-1587(+)